MCRGNKDWVRRNGDYYWPAWAKKTIISFCLLFARFSRLKDQRKENGEKRKVKSENRRRCRGTPSNVPTRYPAGHLSKFGTRSSKFSFLPFFPFCEGKRRRKRTLLVPKKKNKLASTLNLTFSFGTAMRVITWPARPACAIARCKYCLLYTSPSPRD